jgi:hypothetical protein
MNAGTTLLLSVLAACSPAGKDTGDGAADPADTDSTTDTDTDADTDADADADTDDGPAVQVFEACEGKDFPVIDPVEGYAWTPNAITLVSDRVAEGVFAVYDANADA